jgi:hypothetical protein
MDRSAKAQGPAHAQNERIQQATAPRGRGGRLATLVSLLALGFSAFTTYDSVLKRPRIELYVPPVIHYARDFGGEIEVLALPVTIANEGAQSGTVLSIAGILEDVKSGARKEFYSAYLGEFPADSGAVKKPFAPLTIQGKSAVSSTILLYPQPGGPRHVIEDVGEFRVSLALSTAPGAPGRLEQIIAGGVQPVSIVYEVLGIAWQALDQRRQTLPMFQKGFRPPLPPADASAPAAK